MPHLIITYGPAGSGKGFIKGKYIPLLQKMYPDLGKLTPDNTFVAEIDNYIESDSEYKQQVFAIMCAFFDTCQKGLGSTTQLSRYIDTLLKDFTKTGACSASQLSKDLTQVYKAFKGKYNRILDRDIATAVSHGQNIIFESTGQFDNPLDWLWHCPAMDTQHPWTGPFCTASTYVTTITYPHVAPDVILERTRKRFRVRVLGWYNCFRDCSKLLSEKSFTSFQTCLQMQSDVTAPRLPDLVELKEIIPRSQKNLVPYILNNRIDNIIVFDNAPTKNDPVCFNLKKLTLKNKDRIQKAMLDFGGNMEPDLVEAIMGIHALHALHA